MSAQNLAELDQELDQLADGKSVDQLMAIAARAERFDDLSAVDTQLEELSEGLDLPPPPPPREPPPPVSTAFSGHGTTELTTADLKGLEVDEPEEESTDQFSRRELDKVEQEAALAKSAEPEELPGESTNSDAPAPDSLEQELENVLEAPQPDSEELPTVELSLDAALDDDEDVVVGGGSLSAADLFAELEAAESEAPPQAPIVDDRTVMTEMSAIADLASVLEDDDEELTTAEAAPAPEPESDSGRLFSDRDIEAIRRASSVPPSHDSEPALTLSDSTSMEAMNDELDDLIIDDLDDSLELLVDEEDSIDGGATEAPPTPDDAAAQTEVPPEVGDGDDDDGDDEGGKKKGFFKKLFG